MYKVGLKDPQSFDFCKSTTIVKEFRLSLSADLLYYSL